MSKGVRPDFPMSEVELLPPLLAPEKILCIGINYNRDSEYKDMKPSSESGYCSMFFRTPGSLVGHDQPILLPPESDQLDYEGEIAIIIGKEGRRVPKHKALEHIMGFTLCNEGCLRDWMRHGKFNVTQGKNFDATGSYGPWIVTVDEFGGKYEDIKLACRVNGETRQSDTTKNILFDFAYTGLTARSACGQIGAPDAHWLGFAFYLTLTQSWFYAVICRASLAYQYGPVAAVSWSISVEMFFYLAYVVVAMLIAERRWSPRDAMVMAGTAFCLIVIYFLLCRYYEEDINRIGVAIFGPAASTDNGYEESLMRWLLYFNPAARLGEFLAGLAAAHLYLAQRPATFSAPRASAVTLTAIGGGHDPFGALWRGRVP